MDTITVFDMYAPRYASHSYFRGDEQAVTDLYFPTLGKLLIGGVGAGRTVPFLQKRGFDITAVDISPEMITECSKKGIEAQVMDIQRTTFADNSFEYIFLPFHTLCYVDSVPETLKEMRRILKPKGVLIANVSNRRYIKDILKGQSARKSLIRVFKDTAPELTSYNFSFLEPMPPFKRVIVRGRAELQNIPNPNWKDRFLTLFPFLDKSLYFICS